MHGRVAGGTRGGGQRDGRPVHALGDPAQPVGAVVLRIQRGDDGQQHLGGADVGRRALASDVLFAGLQGQPVRRAALRVHRDADQAPRQRPPVGLADGDERRVRTAVHHRHPEPLGRPHHDVGALLAGRRDQQAGQQVGGHDDPHVPIVQPGDDVAVVVQGPGGGRVLQQDGEGVVGDRVLAPVPHGDREAERLGPGAHDREGLRVHVPVDGEHVPVGALGAVAQRHRLGRSGGLVEQGRVRDVHAGEVADHRLEVEQDLEPALGDLGLVGRVGRVPGGVLQDVALDDRGRDGPVVAEPEVRPQGPVAARERLQLPEDTRFRRGRRDRVQRVVTDRRRHGLGQQLVHGAAPEVGQHPGVVVGTGADVARHELAVGLQLGEGTITHGGGLFASTDGSGAWRHRTIRVCRPPTSCPDVSATARRRPREGVTGAWRGRGAPTAAAAQPAGRSRAT